MEKALDDCLYFKTQGYISSALFCSSNYLTGRKTKHKMKYIKNYSTIAQATADTTAVSPLLAFCSENAQVFNLMGGV